MLFHLQINWRWGRHTQIFYDLRHHITRAYFRVVIGSQIVVLPTIPLSQWHSRGSNPWPWLWYHLSDRELCYSTSKPIGDKEDIFKSFINFDITLRGPVFIVVVESQIVVLLTISPSQWHSHDSNPWPWLWYHLSNQLCLSTLKPIGERWGRHIQIFYDLQHHTTWAYFRVVVGSQIVVLPIIPPS